MQDELTLIADKVRGVAAEKRKDQEAIAGILGISRQSVSQRFNGRVPFTATEVYKLSLAWGEPVARFFPSERAA
jgi:transcriptional regulator with XRE-family HTH domain